MATLLKVAGLSRSAFYYQAKALAVGDKYASLKVSIQAIYKRHKGRYGYRRITDALRQAGQTVNHKKVKRLMDGLGLKSLVRPKKYRSYKGEYASAPTLLDRQFEAARPNEKWVTDVTEFNVRGKKLYLSPVMDLYNGEIVAYEMQERPLYSLALAKLKDGGEAPLMHSDQGWPIRYYNHERIKLKLKGLSPVQYRTQALGH